MKNERGFTIIEVIISIIVLTVGLLGLVTTAALVTRMIARGQRSAVASTFALKRMEQLRPAACIPAQAVGGTETLSRGSTVIATNVWRFTPGGGQTVRIQVITTHLTVKNRSRTDTLETSVSCLT
jgi:prepilin-type N-terminal cleavage/methylation domain-containing protein